jgi:hypothetical protein
MTENDGETEDKKDGKMMEGLVTPFAGGIDHWKYLI